MQPARLIEVYKSKRWEIVLIVQCSGEVTLHTVVDDFPNLLRPPESRDEVVDMTEIDRRGA